MPVATSKLQIQQKTLKLRCTCLHSCPDTAAYHSPSEHQDSLTTTSSTRISTEKRCRRTCNTGTGARYSRGLEQRTTKCTRKICHAVWRLQAALDEEYSTFECMDNSKKGKTLFCFKILFLLQYSRFPAEALLLFKVPVISKRSHFTCKVYHAEYLYHITDKGLVFLLAGVFVLFLFVFFKDFTFDHNLRQPQLEEDTDL